MVNVLYGIKGSGWFISLRRSEHYTGRVVLPAHIFNLYFMEYVFEFCKIRKKQ